VCVGGRGRNSPIFRYLLVSRLMYRGHVKKGRYLASLPPFESKANRYCLSMSPLRKVAPGPDGSPPIFTGCDPTGETSPPFVLRARR